VVQYGKAVEREAKMGFTRNTKQVLLIDNEGKRQETYGQKLIPRNVEPTQRERLSPNQMEGKRKW
jgi:hypothetical protein